jgi:CP family cyanate transporter-like MFS transporter
MQRPRLRLVAAIVLLGINLRTLVASLPPLLSDVRADLGLSASVAGLLTTLPVLCFGVLALAAPRLARRFPLERVLVAAALATAGGAALRGLGSTTALFAGSLLGGAAIGIGQATLPVFIREAHPRATGLLIGAYSMSLPLGATLGSAAAVPLARALGDSWSASLAAWALPAAAAAAVWIPAAARGRTVAHGPVPDPVGGAALAWWVAAYMGIQSMAFYAGLAWLPEILQDRGWSAGAAGGLVALASLISIVPAFLVPVLAARRRGQALAVTATAAIGCAGLLGLLWTPAAAPAWMLLVGVGNGASLGLGLAFPVLRAAGAPVVASLTAMSLCVGYLMAATGPWILGAVHDVVGGWTAPLVVLLAITLLQLLPGLPAARDRVLGAAGDSGPARGYNRLESRAEEGR